MVAIKAPLMFASALAAPKNVLYFIVDDLRPEFGGYGQSQMKTPNFDKLMSGSLVFENAYCQQAVCGPSRASFMTGRRPHRTMVFDNGADFRTGGIDVNGPGAKWTTMPGHFKAKGFTSLGAGKTYHPKQPHWDGEQSWSDDFGYFDFQYFCSESNLKPRDKSYDGPCPYFKNPGYDAPCSGAGGPSTNGVSKIDTWCSVDEPDENFYDYGLANATIERLRHVAEQYSSKGKPFFLQAGFARPHAPWRVPKRFWDLYRDEDIKLAVHKLPPDNMPGVAWYAGSFYNASNGYVWDRSLTEPLPDYVAQQMRHAYYAAVSWTDHQIGRVLDELDRLGLADDTAVVLHGDHGWQLGEHNNWHKFTNFELGTRIPLVIRAPWKTKSTGHVSRAMVELVDLYPTLADLVKSGAPDNRLDGVSLAPLFDDPSQTSIPTSHDQGTENKKYAFSQYPHTSDWNCTFFVGGTCQNDPPSASNRLAGAKSQHMGFSVRTRELRYTVRLPWNGTAAQWNADSLEELYDHSSDDGTDFDAMDVTNVAYDPLRIDTVAELFAAAEKFFNEVAPPSPTFDADSLCLNAGGVINGKKEICCAASCGVCGGSGCSNLPGGSESCCSAKIKDAGFDCAMHSAPCLVRPGVASMVV